MRVLASPRPPMFPSSRASGPALAQAFERVEDKRKRLQVHPDRLHRRGRDGLVHRHHSQDRLALVLGFVGQRCLTRSLFLLGKVRCAQDPEHTLHRLGASGIQAPHPGMRHRAQQQLREDHTLGAEVLAGQLGGPHRRVQDLVIVAAAAEVAREQVRRLFARLGFGFFASMPTMLIVKPGAQKALWNPPSSMTACCTG